jgi:hypothetical protein
MRTNTRSGIGRRAFLQGGTLALVAAMGAVSMESGVLAATAGAENVTGKGIGDFDFLAGEWKIHHRRLKDGTTDAWDEFDSGATVHRVLDGMGSIEELRRPDGTFMGMGVRVWHSEEQMWADHWTSAGNGVVNPPQMGRFIDNAGVFVSEEEIDGSKWLYRGVWDQITPISCRWHQSSSSDGGASWEWNWWMDWTRVG